VGLQRSWLDQLAWQPGGQPRLQGVLQQVKQVSSQGQGAAQGSTRAGLLNVQVDCWDGLLKTSKLGQHGWWQMGFAKLGARTAASGGSRTARKRVDWS